MKWIPLHFDYYYWTLYSCLLFEQFLRKKLNMPKGWLIWDIRHVNSLHVKLEIGLIFIYLIASCYFMFKFESLNMAYVMFTYLGMTYFKSMDGMEV